MKGGRVENLRRAAATRLLRVGPSASWPRRGWRRGARSDVKPSETLCADYPANQPLPIGAPYPKPRTCRPTVTETEHIIEAIALIAAPYPLWRLLCFPPFLRGRTGKAVVLAGVLVIYIAAVAGIAFWAPGTLRYLAVLGAAAAMFLWYRSLPRFGRRRGLPPGRLTLLPVDPTRDLHFYEKQAATHGPVFKTGAALPLVTLRPMVCVVGHRLGLELLSRHEEALAVTPVFPFSRFIPSGFLRNMALADHQIYSKVFHSAFSKLDLERLAPAIAESSRIALTRMSEDAASAPSRGIDPRPYLRAMMFETLALVFFGIRRDTESLDRLKGFYEALDLSSLTRRSRRSRLEPGLTQMMDFLRDHAGRTDCVARELIRIDPDSLDDRTVLGNLIQMVESGGNDIAGLLNWTVNILAGRTEWLDRVRAESDGPFPASRSLADRVVSETLRVEQSEYLYRSTIKDIHFDGHLIPKGWMLRICIREGHRDPRTFDQPDEFNPDRFLDRQFAISQYAPFGLFRHRCVGAQLTQVVGRLFVTVLAENFDLAIVRDGPREHPRFHWEPHRNFSVAVMRRPSETKTTNRSPVASSRLVSKMVE